MMIGCNSMERARRSLMLSALFVPAGMHWTTGQSNQVAPSIFTRSFSFSVTDVSLWAVQAGKRASHGNRIDMSRLRNLSAAIFSWKNFWERTRKILSPASLSFSPMS